MLGFILILGDCISSIEILRDVCAILSSLGTNTSSATIMSKPLNISLSAVSLFSMLVLLLFSTMSAGSPTPKGTTTTGHEADLYRLVMITYNSQSPGIRLLTDE